MEHYNDLKTAIFQHESIDVIKKMMNFQSRKSIEMEDDEHLDNLHYAIQANNVEALYLILSFQHFGCHRRPSKVPYVHLACLYGHITILRILLVEQCDDYLLHNIPASSDTFRKLVMKMKQLDDCANEKECQIDRYEFASSGDEDLLAVDVAAAFGHLKCVQLLLDVQVVSDSKMSLLEKAVSIKSYRCLELLLRLEDQTTEDINKAFKVALTKKLARCVDVLLNHGASPQSILNGMNAYHVMYMYSSAFQKMGAERHHGLADTTQVLIQHNQPLHTCIRPASYPLYSLIHAMVQEKDYAPSKLPFQHIECLKLLLQAGADPTFDEVGHTKSLYQGADAQFGLTVGRELYTSGLNALFTALEQSDNWKQFDPQHIDTCCRLILQHGGKPSRLDFFGETPLHDVMKALAIQHAIGNMNLDFSCMVNSLLQYGADADLKSSHDLYPFLQYFNTLFNTMGGNIAFRRWKNSGCIRHIMFLLKVMSHGNAWEMYQQLMSQQQQQQQQHSEATAEPHKQSIMYQVPADIQSYILDEIQQVLGTAPDLTMLCHRVVWKSIGRNLVNLDQLPIPASIKRSVLSLFH